VYKSYFQFDKPFNEDHADMLLDEMIRQHKLSDKMGLGDFALWYQDKFDTFVSDCIYKFKIGDWLE